MINLLFIVPSMLLKLSTNRSLNIIGETLTIVICLFPVLSSYLIMACMNSWCGKNNITIIVIKHCYPSSTFLASIVGNGYIRR